MAIEYVKSLEKILDFASDMVDVRRDQVEKLLKDGGDPSKKETAEYSGLGRQRLVAAEAKARNLVHSFRVDYSGRYECIAQDI